MQYTTRYNQQKRRKMPYARGLAFYARQFASLGDGAISSARTGGLRVALMLFCLCALALAGCAQNTGSTSTQHIQQQGQTSDLTYVALGASDTFGIGTDDPYVQNWPSDLAKKLNQPVHLINLGIPGITVHEALTSELPIALDAHPALVTVWLAVNDLATNVPVNSYKRDLNTLLSRLQAAAPHARIAVGSMPDLTSVPFFFKDNPLTLEQQIAAYNAAISSAVTSHHAILVDLSRQGYNLQAHPEYISHDGLHPSDIGYAKLAMLFYDSLQHA
ncbi:MAG TPA: SGNH/GDSL hydrolase family protein [Ktedonobacteraceae bacterium]